MKDSPPKNPRQEIVEHLGVLRAFALSLTRHSQRADDLVQETIMKAWANIDRFEPGTNMRAWLFTILRNTFYSERRKAKREVPDVDDEMAGKLAERPAHDGQLAFDEFLKVFAKLPVEQREALILVGAQGFSYEEAADMVGCPPGTVKSRANRGRKKLAQLLGLNPHEDNLTGDGVIEAVMANQTKAW